MHVVLLLFRPLPNVGIQNFGIMQLDCFTVHTIDHVGYHICAQPSSMWKRLRFLQVLQIFWKRKSDVNKYDIKMKLSLTWKIKSNHPQRKWNLKQMFCIFWSKLGDSCLNGWHFIAQTSRWLKNGWKHTHTDRRRQRQYPKVKTGLG